MIELRHVVLSLCVLASAQVSAQSLEERLRDCSKKQGSAEKLACYESLTAPVAAPPPAPPPATANAKDEEFGMQGELLRRKRASEPVSKPSEPQTLVARVASVTRRQGDMYAFELDNGQVWVQTHKLAGPPASTGEQVTITGGVLGSYFLEYESGLRSRVMRVR